ncbi:M56 family metallopeptidase [Paraflavitalea pollutisoli]|uniref:M56 family metallopeptidase n=1 Tax=Paraflavitalea pollutisoli TaxID=3034143 RepID=UPI0023EE05B4|nr:M56 family metallopeptidase [Paraflavitalea sp. H1-2-19X]
MPTFFIVLFKINLVLILFVAVYYAILRRLTYYGLNRFFLLLGILFSCSYPLMDLSGFFDASDKGAVPELSRQFRSMLTVEATPVYINYVYGLFFIGFAYVLVRIVKQALSLYRIHLHSQKAVIGDQPVQLINEPVGAFSFCRKIYINPSLHQQEALPTIIAHERVHVRQWHSLDILLVELGLLLYWFNPAAWLMRKAVKENLEYIADHAVLRGGADRRSYQYSLLQVTAVHNGLAITNDFNLVDLKQRIRMMNRKRSSRFMLMCYVVLLPVLVIGCLAFTVSVKDSVQELLQPQELMVVEESVQSAAQADLQPVMTIQLKPASAQQPGAERSSAASRRGRGVTAQPLSTSLQEPLYERPSTAGIRPGTSANVQPDKPQLQEVIVTGYATPRKKPADAEGTNAATPPHREVAGFEVPGRSMRVGQPGGAVGGAQVSPAQRIPGIKLTPADTALQSVRIVQGYRNP